MFLHLSIFKHHLRYIIQTEELLLLLQKCKYLLRIETKYVEKYF